MSNAERFGLAGTNREISSNQKLEDQFCPPPGETMMADNERLNTLAMTLGGIGVGLIMNSNGLYLESAPVYTVGLMAAGMGGFESIRRHRYRVTE